MQSNRTEDIKMPLGNNEQQVVKKAWVKPQVTEISKFSILAGLDNTKAEGGSPTFYTS